MADRCVLSDKVMLKVPLSPEKAYAKAQNFCVYQERSQQEIRDKIYSWGLHLKEVENIISRLIDEGFLKEERFAVAFAGGKFRIKKWGKVKIKQALKEKRITSPLIKKALSEISDVDYRKMLVKVLAGKEKTVKEKDPFKRKYKLANYAISRGYESELVWQILGEIESE